MTANDLIRRALLSIGVIGESDTPTGSMASDAFQTLNMFLSSLGAEGFVTMQYTNPDDDIGLDDGYELMIQTNLAVLLAADYTKEAPPSVKLMATNSKRVLKRSTTLPRRPNLDELRGLRRYGDFDIINGDYV